MMKIGCLLLVLLAATYEGLTGSGDPAITGAWLSEDGTTQLRMELVDPGTGVVSGTYLLTDPDMRSLSFSGAVSGQYDFPAVALDYSFVFESFSIPCALRGTMAASGQTIAATMTCTGFGESGSDAVDLRRSPSHRCLHVGRDSLCVPGTTAFTAWLNGIENHDADEVAACSAGTVPCVRLWPLRTLIDTVGSDPMR
jgi:hypothetical protein